MPVRFRCRHCNQLLGIARRKIGMEVSCPTCQHKVLVPATDAPDVDHPTVRKADAPFEGSDLDALLQPSLADAPAAETRPPLDVEIYNPPAAPGAGLLLSPLHTALLTTAVALLLALFFGVGLLIGRFWF